MMAGRLRARSVAIAIAVGTAAVGLLGGAAVPAAAQTTVLAAPTVTGVSPNSGPAGGGTNVTITGTGFAPGATVAFGANPATNVQFVNSGILSATSPAGTAGATVDVEVTTAGGTSAANPPADSFTYGPAGPTVTSVSPKSGPTAGGTTVTITGTSFTSGSTVKFGATAAASVTFVNSGILKAVSPPGTGGTTVDVEVTTTAGTSPANPPADSFTFKAGPTVTGLSPKIGPTAGGTTVSITGTGFTNTATVKFGATAAASVTFVNSGNLQAVSPLESAGTVQVQVTTAEGTSPLNPPADNFTFKAGPSVTGLSPKAGPTAGGTTVTITGSGFTSAATVKFGTTAASSVTFLNSGALKAVSPAESAGTVDVTVTTAEGTSATSSADKFTYTAGPTVTGLSPKIGPTAGGTTVVITGTGFINGATVAFGATAATSVTFVNSTSLKAVSPAGTAGTIQVRVTTGEGTSPLNPPADNFTYKAGPNVTGLSPKSGPTAGGTEVTITGFGFTAAATVAFGLNAATSVTFVSSTTLTAVSPAGAVGTVDVTVTTAEGTSATVPADQFTYKAGPTVTGLSPKSGPAAGGTTVTITGTGFTAAATVAFGANPATGVTFVSSTTLTAVSPAGAVGMVDVQVTTAEGTSPANGSDLFTYH